MMLHPSSHGSTSSNLEHSALELFGVQALKVQTNHTCTICIYIPSLLPPPLFSLLLASLTTPLPPNPQHHKHTVSPHNFTLSSTSYHPLLVTSLSTTVPGGGLKSCPRFLAKKRVLILLVTMMKVNLGL